MKISQLIKQSRNTMSQDQNDFKSSLIRAYSVIMASTFWNEGLGNQTYVESLYSNCLKNYHVLTLMC